MFGHFTKVLMVCVVILYTTQCTKARPSKGTVQWNSIVSDIKYCSSDIKIQELCQRCAKATKSDIAYPMCCTNEDGAYVWCDKYLNFGLQ